MTRYNASSQETVATATRLSRRQASVQTETPDSGRPSRESFPPLALLIAKTLIICQSLQNIYSPLHRDPRALKRRATVSSRAVQKAEINQVSSTANDRRG